MTSEIGFRKLTSLIVSLALVLSSQGSRAGTLNGSGVIVGQSGEILTAAHVVPRCSLIQVRAPLEPSINAVVIARDAANDLALLRAKSAFQHYVSLSPDFQLSTGDSVIVVGYPLQGLLSSKPIVTTGVVSALAGMFDDSRYIQITAPMQPGNSGGAVLDQWGNLAGIAIAKMNYKVAVLTGALPENINFALKAELVALFLNSVGYRFHVSAKGRALSPGEISTRASQFAVAITCYPSKPGVESANVPGRRHMHSISTSNRRSVEKQLDPSWLGNR